MSFTNYTDVSVTLEGKEIFASSVSASSNLSLSPVRAIGIQGSAGMIPDGPAGGEISLDMVGGAGGYAIPADLTDASKCITAIGFGNASLNVYPNSFSISMSPNEVVSASFAGQSFEPLDLSGADGGTGKKGVGSGTIFSGGHGASTGSSGAETNAEYSFSASWDSIYFIGSMCPVHVFCTDASVECTVEGPNITGNISMSCESPCPGQETVSFTIGSLCSTSSPSTYGCTGYVTSSGLSVSEGGVLSGTQTVVEFLA